MNLTWYMTGKARRMQIIRSHLRMTSPVDSSGIQLCFDVENCVIIPRSLVGCLGLLSARTACAADQFANTLIV